MEFKDEKTLSRRTFVTGSLAGLALATAAGSTLYACSPSDGGQGEAEGGNADASQDDIVWSQCNVNCAGRCVFQWHTKEGKILYMETDNTGDTDLQARACLRGRNMRRWINSADRLMYPMKRVGKRGEGKFEQISWDEAIDTIADKLKEVIDTYGNEAVYNNYATGMYSATGRSTDRLMNLIGGSLGGYYDYSSNMMQAAGPFMFGEEFSPYDSVHASSMSEAENSDLVVMFGNSPAETRMGGANIVWDFAKVREAGARIINIDYRFNETSSGSVDEWLPIRSGTDAALASALAHEFIVNDQADVDFLHEYCVGYDDETMPESAKGQNKSYYDYIMGTGYDQVEKTPEWAAPITQIPADRIRELANDLANARAPFVVQGWGSQRHSNGETTTLAICMIPIMLGQIGLPGTNTGMREAEPGALVGGLPNGDNPVEASINVYQWLNAVDHGEEMTATNAGVKGVEKLPTGIKFLWNYAGNCITNQHGEINKVHEILQDESKLEFIVVTDTVMTDSAKYADILLPDAMRGEQLNMSTNGYAEYYLGVCVGGPAQDAPGECRTSYDVNADIADKFGVKDQFTEGKTQEEWIEQIYKEGADADGDMPSWEEIQEQGFYKRALDPVIGLKDFRDDPQANPLATPSGKIEIYSEDLAEIAETWELEEGEVISPIPIFDPGFEGYTDLNDEYPLLCSGFHHKSRAHSSFGFLEELEQACRNQMWINPIDADERGIANGDVCAVKSPAGELRIEARVTPRIIPGTIGIPQGAWHNADMDGDQVDHGGCINTITTYRPTPLAKGNGVHSIIAQVTKA